MATTIISIDQFRELLQSDKTIFIYIYSGDTNLPDRLSTYVAIDKVHYSNKAIFKRKFEGIGSVEVDMGHPALVYAEKFIPAIPAGQTIGTG
jgi:hypothetical protein